MRRTTFVLAVALGFLAGAASFARADGTAEPSPSPSAPDFMATPAYDLDIVGKSAYQVGDTLEARVAHDFGEGARFGETDPTDQGWEYEPGRPVTGELRLTLHPVKKGSLTLSALPILDAQGKAVGHTNPLSVEVRSAIDPKDPKPKEPVDVRPPVGLPYPWWVVALLSGLGVVAACGLAYLIYRLFKRFRKPAPPAKAAPPRPEDELALSRLAELERRGLAPLGKFKEHYFVASEILKFYLGERYRFDALESTSREIVQNLEDRKRMSEDTIDRLEDLMMRMDRVKFADDVPSAEEATRVLGEIREIVQITRRKPLGTEAPVAT